MAQRGRSHDAVVQKVTPKLVEVFYADDNETKRHNLLVSGISLMARRTKRHRE